MLHVGTWEAFTSFLADLSKAEVWAIFFSLLDRR